MGNGWGWENITVFDLNDLRWWNFLVHPGIILLKKINWRRSVRIIYWKTIDDSLFGIYEENRHQTVLSKYVKISCNNVQHFTLTWNPPLLDDIQGRLNISGYQSVVEGYSWRINISSRPFWYCSCFFLIKSVVQWVYSLKLP